MHENQNIYSDTPLTVCICSKYYISLLKMTLLTISDMAET